VSAPSEQGSAVPGKVEEGDVASLNVGQLTSGNLTAIVANLGTIMHFAEEGGAGYILDDYGLTFFDSNGDVSFDAGGPDGSVWARGAFETVSAGGSISIAPGSSGDVAPTPVIRFWAAGGLDHSVIFSTPSGSGPAPSGISLRSSQYNDRASFINLADNRGTFSRMRVYPPGPGLPNGSLVPQGGMLRVYEDQAVLGVTTAVNSDNTELDGGTVDLTRTYALIGHTDGDDYNSWIQLVDDEIVIAPDSGLGTVYVVGELDVVPWIRTTEIRSTGGGVILSTSSNSAPNNEGPPVFLYWASGNLHFGLASNGSNIKTFVIDHPDDSERWLVHACLEGPTADVFYRGTATIVDGRAEVELPGYFESATRAENRQVQLTPVAALCRVAASRIENGRFTIISDAPDGTQVAWLVYAERADTEPFDPEPLRSEINVQGSGPYRYFARKDDASNVPAPAPAPAEPAKAARFGRGVSGGSRSQPWAANRGPELRTGDSFRPVASGRAADRVPPAAAGGAGRPDVADRRVRRTELTELWRNL